MAGLFDMPTPEAIRLAARRDAMDQARLFAQAPPGRGFVQAAGQAGGLFGEAIGRGMGGQLPGEDKAMKFQAIQQKVAQDLQGQNIDVSTPDGFIQMAKLTADYANQAGLPEIAQKAGAQALEVRKQFAGKEQTSPFDKIDPSKYTPESINKFEVTGRYADLQAKPEKDTENLSPGELAIDKAFAKDYVDWTTGGYADVVKNLTQLKDVERRLKAGNENLTGPIIGKTPDIIKNVSNPAAIDVRDEVQEVVQRNLRLILGAQFTEREGEKLIARAYNENLDESVNAKRVGRLVKAIEDAAQAKQKAVDYYNRNGTLKGFKGKQITLDDISKSLDKEIKSSGKVTSDGWSIRKK